MPRTVPGASLGPENRGGFLQVLWPANGKDDSAVLEAWMSIALTRR
jgi:hypothetical protein